MPPPPRTITRLWSGRRTELCPCNIRGHSSGVCRKEQESEEERWDRKNPPQRQAGVTGAEVTGAEVTGTEGDRSKGGGMTGAGGGVTGAGGGVTGNGRGDRSR